MNLEKIGSGWTQELQKELENLRQLLWCCRGCAAGEKAFRAFRWQGCKIDIYNRVVRQLCGRMARPFKSWSSVVSAFSFANRFITHQTNNSSTTKTHQTHANSQDRFAVTICRISKNSSGDRFTDSESCFELWRFHTCTFLCVTTNLRDLMARHPTWWFVVTPWL